MQQRRAFSVSQPLGVSAINFPKTSSKELDELLEKIRYDIILPSYLPALQRKRLHNRKYKAALEADPITMEIDGEKLRFYYRDLLKEMPNTKDLLRKVVALMKTPDDWAVLPRLLEGVCVQGKRKLKKDDYSKLVRKASLAGCVHTVLTCAREVKRTNFKLDNREVVTDLLANIQVEAVRADYSEEATNKALQRTERVMEMLEDENHQPKLKRGQTEAHIFPLYKEPIFLAARLHMAAALAVKHRGGVDEDGKVTKYAKELVTLWPENQGMSDLYKTDEHTGGKANAERLRHPAKMLITGAPVQNGMQLAAQVVDAELAKELRNRAQAVAKDVQAAWAQKPLREGSRMYEVYDKLINRELKSTASA